VAFEKKLSEGTVMYQTCPATVLVAKLALATATVTAVTIAGWPAAAVISLIVAALIMMRWILHSTERTKRLISVIFALRSKGTFPTPGRRCPKPRTWPLPQDLPGPECPVERSAFRLQTIDSEPLPATVPQHMT
jgi:hypothetical protein